MQKTKTMLFAAALLVACSSDNNLEKAPEQPEEEPIVNMLPKSRAIKLTDDQQALVQKSNEFSFNLYRAINDEQTVKKSNFTSPFSVTYLMGMLNDGSTGVTADEIVSVIGFGENDKEVVNSYCQAFISQVPSADPSTIIKNANIVAVDKDVVLEDLYLENMKKYYEAEAASLDFDQSSSLDYLNKWCSDKTDGMIPQIIDHIDSQTKLILMNAISFKASWMDSFDKADTRDEQFCTADGSKTTIPMMHRKAQMLYRANDTYSTISLAYGDGSRWVLHVLLPEEGKTVDDIINSLNSTSWNPRSVKGTQAVVDIKLPRFETRSEVDLIGPLKSLGASSMFDSDKADFSHMSKNYKRLYVGEMKQKTAVEVNEDGTEASVVTEAEMLLGSPDQPSEDETLPKVDFHVNRPFVYMIQEWDSQAIFFIGTYQGY